MFFEHNTCEEAELEGVGKFAECSTMEPVKACRKYLFEKIIEAACLVAWIIDFER